MTHSSRIQSIMVRRSWLVEPGSRCIHSQEAESSGYSLSAAFSFFILKNYVYVCAVCRHVHVFTCLWAHACV